jgi:hypothetical protein
VMKAHNFTIDAEASGRRTYGSNILDINLFYNICMDILVRRLYDS